MAPIRFPRRNREIGKSAQIVRYEGWPPSPHDGRDLSLHPNGLAAPQLEIEGRRPPVYYQHVSTAVPDRNVNCLICKQLMFYEGDSRCEPEVIVELKLPRWQEAVQVNALTCIFGIQKFYAHVRCWNATIKG